MIIGTAGHIDHGKTSLVKALTGVNADRLVEEQQRGITIDLGFAYTTLANGARLGFVDVPGHEKLIHTMATGAASIDFAMLVIAADDGVMPQTREHLDILSLLGITQGLIALTRIDLVDEARRHEVAAEIRNFLLGSFLEDAPFFAVSSHTGEGIENLQNYLQKQAGAFSARPINGRFRHAVDRCFTLKGTGTIVTGSVLSGAVNNGDQLVIAPKRISARIRSLHVQDEAATSTKAGDRAALNLAGDAVSRDAIQRGDMLVDPFLNRPTTRFDARITILGSEPKPLKQWFPVRFHHASNDMAARLVFLQQDQGQPDSETLVQIITERPIIAVTGDRFLLRDTSASRTLGGGMVIDPFAPARKRRASTRFAWLDAMAKPAHEEALAALLALPPFAVNWQDFCRARNIDENGATALLATHGTPLIENGQDQLVIAQNQLERLRADIIKTLEDFHRVEPDLPGMGLERVRRSIAPEIKAPIFRALIDSDIKAGFLKLHGAWISLSSHEAQLSEPDEQIWQKVAQVLTGELRFRPPRTRDFAHDLDIDEAHMRQILKSVSRMGRTYEVAQDYFFPRHVLHEIITILQDIAEKNEKGEFNAADLRDRLDNGRKVAILILEFFDRHGVTLRRGDIRRLNHHRIDLFA